VAKKKQTQPTNSTAPDPVTQYALDVTGGKEVTGPLVRLACERHLRDLAEGPARGLVWDFPAADRVFRYYSSVLRLAGGKHEGKPFNLEPPQKFIIGSLFGWKRADGIRRFTTAYIEMGKGGGKSPLGGGLGLYMCSADGEPRAECFAAAVDKDQARIPFGDAVAMVDQSPTLSQNIEKSPKNNPDSKKVWNLAHLKSGSSFRPIASESMGRGKSGFRPYFVLIDEVHEHRTDAMVEFMRKNIKGRPNALVFMITNSGVYDVASVCWRYHEYSRQLMEQTVDPDDEFFAYVCGLDVGDSWTDPAVWKKSIPTLGVTVPVSYLEKEVREAKGMPSKQSLTRRLNFCEWVESADPWIDSDVWRANGDSVNVESLAGRRCYGGLDLSRRNDLTALVFVFEPDANGKKAVLPFFWKAEDTLREHSERDRAKYVEWKEMGLLETTPGSAINYEFIAAKLEVLAARYRIEAIAFDPAKIDELTPYLNNIGADIVLKPHRQGFGEMDGAIQAAETDLLERRLQHGNHEVLTWCINNVRVVENSEAKRMFDKRKATGRIDGAVALAMADLLSENLTPAEFQVFFV
jgi:phage terminase large subunit-like protein